MKAIFLSLVLLNFAYLGWQAWIVPEKAPPALNETEGVPRLVMIGEDPDDPGLGASYKVPTRASEITRQTAKERPAVSFSSTEQQAGEAAAETAEQLDAQSARQVALAPPTQTGSAAQTTQSGQQDMEPVPPQRTEDPAGESVMASLTASSAVDTRLTETAPAGPIEVAVAQRGLRCVSLGPFLNLREATEASSMLIEAGLEPSQRLSESQVWFGHWVHLPALATRAAAVAVVEDLKKNGVTDIYIEPSGPMKNSISLGVFSDRAHAETRAGSIRKFGISPQIRDRYRDSSVYWVDFEMPGGQVIDPGAYQSSPNRVLRIEGRTCPEDG